MARVLVATGTTQGLEEAASRSALASALQRVTDVLTSTFGFDAKPGFGLGLAAGQMRSGLRAVCNNLSADDLMVVYHTGHADLAGAQHRLWWADTVDRYTNSMLTAELAELVLADTPVTRALIILDTCHAGAGGAEALLAGMRSLADPAGWGAKGKTLAVITAAHPREQILPGQFADLFARAAHDRAAAGHEPQFVTLQALVSRMNADKQRSGWQTVGHSVLFQAAEEVLPFFPNPRYDPRLHGLDTLTELRISEQQHRQEDLRSHFGPRARGAAGPDEPGWWFTGRQPVLRAICSWLGDAAADPRAQVVTGGSRIGQVRGPGPTGCPVRPRSPRIGAADRNSRRYHSCCRRDRRGGTCAWTGSRPGPAGDRRQGGRPGADPR